MRKEIIRYLTTHPLDEDGFPLYEWVPNFQSWAAYLVNMAQDHMLGDQLTLFAGTNLFNVNIQIVSSLGTGASRVFQPMSSIPIATLFLGHFAENYGEHYIALNCLSDEDGDEMPAASVNYVQSGNQNGIDEITEDDGDEIAKNASTQAEEIREMENDNDDHDMSTDSATRCKGEHQTRRR